MLGFMKKKKEETISYGVIGLGKFGYTLAIQLAEYGYDFLVPVYLFCALWKMQVVLIFRN